MCNSKLNYTALGDSITDGFMAYLLGGFVYRFSSYLRCKYGCVESCNFGCPGLSSCGLLKQLQCDWDIKHSVKRADIITITIGGNNFLKCTSRDYKCISRRLATKWIEHFKEDWPEILDNIRRKLCSEAEIYVMNLNNPYCPNDENYDIADHYIREFNSIIEDSSLVGEYDYNVVDVYCLFKENRDKEWTFFDHLFLRDPHPNWEGNQQIFLAFEEEYSNNN